MSTTEFEKEAKFYLNDLPALKNKLENLGAEIIQLRIHEFNWRYDLPDGSLKRTYQILRIRKDNEVRMTYKGPQALEDGVPVRPEHEMVVSSLEAAQEILASLGYGVIQVYEKYRTVYQLGDVQVMLDEMPYGDFCELEAPTVKAIRGIADLLGLRLENQARSNYLRLYEELVENQNLDVDGLTFENFAGLEITAGMLSVMAGDA